MYVIRFSLETYKLTRNMSNPNDGQKRYDKFIELVKEAYGAHT